MCFDGLRNEVYFVIIILFDCGRDVKFYNGGFVFCLCYLVSDKWGNIFYFLFIEEIC